MNEVSRLPPLGLYIGKLTFREFRTTQVPWVHRNECPTCRVKADFVSLYDNARSLSLHSVTNSLKLSKTAQTIEKESAVLCMFDKRLIFSRSLHYPTEIASKDHRIGDVR